MVGHLHSAVAASMMGQMKMGQTLGSQTMRTMRWKEKEPMHDEGGRQCMSLAWASCSVAELGCNDSIPTC